MSSVLRGNARRRRPFRRVNRRIGTPTYGGVGAAGREPRWLPNPAELSSEPDSHPRLTFRTSLAVCVFEAPISRCRASFMYPNTPHSALLAILAPQNRILTEKCGTGA